MIYNKEEILLALKGLDLIKPILENKNTGIELRLTLNRKKGVFL